MGPEETTGDDWRWVLTEAGCNLDTCEKKLSKELGSPDIFRRGGVVGGSMEVCGGTFILEGDQPDGLDSLRSHSLTD
jgi:hypothetical protein